MPRGSCLCGAVTFDVTSPLPPPDACHCVACRKTSGPYFVSTDVKKSAVHISDASTIQWFASSEKVRRGFCGTCGSNLFWDPIHHDWMGVAMGAFASKTETNVAVHIFVKEKGDYYTIADDLPQKL